MKCERCGTEFASGRDFPAAGICLACFRQLSIEEQGRLQLKPIALEGRTFDILIREEDGNRVGTAIKQGFSWPGLMFSFFWAFANRLWVMGTVLWVVNTSFNFGLLAFSDEMPAVSWIFGLLNLVVVVVVGIKGNAWRLKQRIQDGFQQLDSVRGSSPSQVLLAKGIAPAPSLAYSMGAVVTGTIFTALALFMAVVSILALIYGDRAFALQGLGSLCMFGITGALLWVRAYRPPMGFLRGLGVTLGGLMLGMPVVGLTTTGIGILGILWFGAGLGVLLVFLGFKPKREKQLSVS